MTAVAHTDATKRVPAAGGSTLAASIEIANRSFIAMKRVPATVIPVIIMPLFFTIAFSGAFSAITELPAFPTDNVLDWMAPFAILQGAAFAGLGAAFSAGRDLETGFYDRMLAAPVPRRALVLGPLLFSGCRALIPLGIVLPMALLGGASFQDPLGFFTLLVAAIGVALVSGLWGLGVAYRTRNQRSGALTQVGIFVALFLTTGQVPIQAMTGWLHEVARINPMTNILALARAGFVGEVTWSVVWPGMLALLGCGAVLGLFAYRGFRRLVP